MPSKNAPDQGGAGTSGSAGSAANGGSAGGGNGASGGVGSASGAAGSAGGAGAPTAGSSGSSSGGVAGTAGGEAFGGAFASAGSAGATAAGSAGVGGDVATGGVAGDGSFAGASGSSGAGGAGSGGTPNGGASGGGGAAGAGYEPCPASGPCKILPFGDSITEGYPVFGGYRMELFRLARADAHEITFVGSVANGPNTVDGVPFPRNHEGHGAHTIEGAMGIAQFVDSSMSNYTPDIVLLMVGTNDINGNVNVANAPARLGALLDDIYAVDPNVLIVLAQIVPTRSDGTNQAVRTYNAAMPALVSQRTSAGRHLVLVDMYEAFTRDESYKTTLLGDNLHPNEAGYTRMAATWYAVLSPYLR